MSTLLSGEEALEGEPCACYCLGLFFRLDADQKPCDFRCMGLRRIAGYIPNVNRED